MFRVISSIRTSHPNFRMYFLSPLCVLKLRLFHPHVLTVVIKFRERYKLLSLSLCISFQCTVTLSVFDPDALLNTLCPSTLRLYSSLNDRDKVLYEFSCHWRKTWQSASVKIFPRLPCQCILIITDSRKLLGKFLFSGVVNTITSSYFTLKTSAVSLTFQGWKYYVICHLTE